MALETAHIPFELLVDLVEGRLDDAPRATCLAHLSGCTPCRAELQRLEHIVDLMRSDERPEPDQGMIRRALRLFTTPPSPQGSSLRHLLARLRVDSLRQPMAFGTRSAQIAVRGLIYSAEERELDMQLTPAPGGWTLSGQLVGGRPAAGHVALRGPQRELRASLGPMREFVFGPVPAGFYSLHVLLDDLEIEVPELVIGA